MNAMMPARQAFTKDIVGLDRLTNAIALSTSGMNTARLLLPGLAGELVAALGGGGQHRPSKMGLSHHGCTLRLECQRDYPDSGRGPSTR